MSTNSMEAAREFLQVYCAGADGESELVNWLEGQVIAGLSMRKLSLRVDRANGNQVLYLSRFPGVNEFTGL